MAAGDHHLLHVGRTGQHDHHDHHGHAAAAVDRQQEGTVDFRQRDRHRREQRRRLVAHRRRDDHHAVDARQRHGRQPDRQPLPAVPRVGRDPCGHRQPLRRRPPRRRGQRQGPRIGMPRMHRSAPAAIHPYRGRRKSAVRAGVQEPHRTAALHGHDGVAGIHVDSD